MARELSDPSAPQAVQAWIKSPPAWLTVAEAIDTDDPALRNLDPGERAAISLGIRLKADLILIDERKGASAALGQGIEVTGTLGILDLAATRKLIDLPQVIEQLKQTNFRYRKQMIEDLLTQHRNQ